MIDERNESKIVFLVFPAICMSAWRVKMENVAGTIHQEGLGTISLARLAFYYHISPLGARSRARNLLRVNVEPLTDDRRIASKRSDHGLPNPSNASRPPISHVYVVCLDTGPLVPSIQPHVIYII